MSEKSLVIQCVTCLNLGCSVTRLLPWALPLLHLSIQPHSENTRYITHISKLPRLTSCAIENHSEREDMQSGGNPRTTTPTLCKRQSLKECAAELVRTWMRDLWVSLYHAESTHFSSDSSRFWGKTLDVQVHRDWSCSWCQGYLSS